MARYLVAVSGGVDSVVLLDMLTKVPGHSLMVAHVDHGIRPDSAEDARFVAQLAAKYQLPFFSTRLELADTPSEERARTARYAFLRDIAQQHDARIVTAHHADDVLETIAINVHRGTGWRGVATHDSDIIRPLLRVHKDEVKAYAAAHGLSWREDSTNQSEQYLRNRIRHHVASLPPEQKKQLLALRQQQIEYKHRIEREVKALIGDGPAYRRYFFTHIPIAAAIECLRLATHGRLTRPQMHRALLAIKTYQPAKRYHAGNGVELDFTPRIFTVTLIK